MASHNQFSRQSNQKSTNIISTRKIVKINRDKIPKQTQLKTATVPNVEANCTPNSANQSGTLLNQSVNHNQYSARNSLRAAKAITPDDKSPNSKGYKPKMTTAFPIIPERGILDTPNYDILDVDYFLICSENNSTICLLCGIRMDERAVEAHLRSDNHNKSYLKLRYHLTTMPPADSSLQMCAISEFLNYWYQTKSLTPDMIALRYDVISDFEQILRIVDPECSYRLLGSMNTGTSLVSSDINLELLHPNSSLFESDPRAKNSIHHQLIDPDAGYGSQINNHTLHYDLIPNAFDTLYKILHATSNKYLNSPGNAFDVVSTLSELNSKMPKLILQHVESRIFLEVICYAGSSYKLSHLLRIYMSLDERAQILATLVKCWAKHCKLDEPDHGTYPPDTFIILVIYYLQRITPPILPCLHEIISKGNKKGEMTSKQSVRVLVDLMGNLKLQEDLQEDNNSNNCLDTENNRNNQEFTDNNNGIADGEEEEDPDGEDVGLFEIDSDFVRNLNWTSENDSPVHKLFIDFLYRMMIEFNNTSSIITIRTLDKVELKNKEWTTSIKAIENPVMPRVNISRCIGTLRTFEYFRSAIQQSYYYLTSIPLDSRLKPKVERQIVPADYIELYVDRRRFISYCKMKESSITNERNYDPIPQMIKQNLFARDVEVLNNLFDSAQGNPSSLPKSVVNFYNESFLLPKDVLSTKYCWLCKKTGHTKGSCPSSKIEKLQLDIENYDIELDIKANFDEAFINHCERESITPALSRLHQWILGDLTDIIKSTGLDCKLQLFGSTVNLLGSRDSDLDICMTLEGNLTGKDVDCVATLGLITDVIRRHKRVEELEPILSARVPILKFKFDQLDVDLSMYNLCAIYNSELLKTYAKFDPRVAQLFFLVKKYAKSCGIADASKGSLSSYAWSLMVIHYLQQIEVPILPVLQECTDGQIKPSIGVGGWNVWFNNDINSYRMQVNSLTLTELFKGFFLYYGSFDFSCYVVSIRKRNLITRFRKNWNHCMMAIEDPFELTYNLSSRLDDAMSIYIMNSFAFAYRHILKVQRDYVGKQLFNSPEQAIRRIFVGKDIMPTSPPYRGCRKCSRIGHKLKDCPKMAKQPRKARSRN